jgi:hypothetical protein
MIDPSGHGPADWTGFWNSLERNSLSSHAHPIPAIIMKIPRDISGFPFGHSKSYNLLFRNLHLFRNSILVLKSWLISTFGTCFEICDWVGKQFLFRNESVEQSRHESRVISDAAPFLEETLPIQMEWVDLSQNSRCSFWNHLRVCWQSRNRSRFIWSQT